MICLSVTVDADSEQILTTLRIGGTNVCEINTNHASDIQRQEM